ASSGEVTLTHCKVTGTDAAGTYTLKATASGLTEATSSNVVIEAGTASKLAFTTQPVGGVAEEVDFSTQPVAKVQDANGNVVTSDNTTVTLARNRHAAGNGGKKQGTLACTTNPVTASSGVATFAGCTV